MSLIVVGTGTDVGKTITCAVIAARYGHPTPVVYWKPVSTGASAIRVENAPSGPDSHTLESLCGARVHVLPELYCYPDPVSPHLAAHRARERIEVDALVRQTHAYQTMFAGRRILIEGVGGVMAPLARDGVLWIDYLAAAHLPVVVVAADIVGTLNHTLLTLEALRARAIEPVGVIVNGLHGFTDTDNIAAIASFGKTTVIDRIAPLPLLTPEAIHTAGAAFDPQGILAPWLEHRSEVTGSR